jgi:hypothetical protein
MENDKTKEDVERDVRSILSFHKGKENAVSRWQLVEQIFGREAAANRSNNNPFDRQIRQVISDWRDIDFIVSTSGQEGYWIAADYADVELLASEYEKRALNMLEKKSNLLKRGLERFGPQIELFKVN